MAARSMFCCRAHSLSVYFSLVVSAFRQLASGVLFVDILYMYMMFGTWSVYITVTGFCSQHVYDNSAVLLFSTSCLPSRPPCRSISSVRDAVCDMLAVRRVQNVKHTASHAHVGLRVDSRNPFIECDCCT